MLQVVAMIDPHSQRFLTYDSENEKITPNISPFPEK